MAKLVAALDVPNLQAAVTLSRQLAGTVPMFKVGLELFVAEGPRIMEAILPFGEVFLDLKLHDIPETVSRAVSSASKLGASLLTVHTSGGRAMMEAAARAAEHSDLGLLGVTVLTSLDAEALGETEGVAQSPVTPRVIERAALAKAAGCKGVVASPLELALLRQRLPSPFLLVSPGIRGPLDKGDDQKRTATAAAAVAAGADLLVVGRPIREAVDPKAAALALLAEMEYLEAGHR